jgi:hypothetical protein
MKKIILGLSLFLVLVSVSSAQSLIGGRAGGMGGTGVANATDLTAVYYNPAGLMKAGNFEFKATISPSYTDYQNLLDAFGKSTDPTDLLQDNFSNDLSFRGDLAGLIGVNFNKIALSVIGLPLGGYAADPLGSANVVFLDKAAGALQGAASYAMRYDTVLTLGYTFALPALPIASLDTGINIKSINATYGTISAAVTDLSAPYIKGSGSGLAFDVGLRTSLDIPVLASAAVGLAIKDIGGKINYNRSQQIYTFDNATQTITVGPETDLDDQSVKLNAITVIGAAATIPMINLGIAADLEITKDETITHLGVEYPFMPFLTGRAGLATSPSISKTTLGVKLGIPVFNLEGAAVIDNKDSSVAGWIIDLGFGI